MTYQAIQAMNSISLEPAEYVGMSELDEALREAEQRKTPYFDPNDIDGEPYDVAAIRSFLRTDNGTAG